MEIPDFAKISDYSRDFGFFTMSNFFCLFYFLEKRISDYSTEEYSIVIHNKLKNIAKSCRQKYSTVEYAQLQYDDESCKNTNLLHGQPKRENSNLCL